MHPIITHWHGNSSLLWSILVNLLGLRLLVGLIAIPTHQAVTFLLAGISSALLVWQVIGTSRSAKRHFREYGDLLMYRFAYAAITMTVILSILHTLDMLAGPPAKITLESLRTRPLPTMSADKTTVYINGDLDFIHSEDLINLLKTHGNISTVELDSNGGLVYAARAIALNINKYGLNTHVEKQCNSACPIAFMAGKQRTLGEKGALGFHQYKLERLQPLQIKSITAEQTKDRAYFLQQGVSQGFLKQLYQSDHDNIWQPDRQILLKAGVIHGNTN